MRKLTKKSASTPSLTKKKPSKKSEFRRYLEKIERPDYPWVVKDLPENASSLDKAKYNICEKILGYQEDNQISDEKLSRQIGINKKRTLQLLFYWIEEFTLDELVSYANKLFTPTQIQVIVREVKSPSTKRLHARSL